MLHESRASSSGKDPLKSTRASFFSRAVGRDTRPSWGNRILKDFYDLDYDFTLDRYSNPSQFTNTHQQQKQRLQADLLKRASRSKNAYNPEQQPSPPSKPQRSVTRAQMMSLSLHLPERIQISTLDATEANRTGLCPFQYANTIRGNIQKRPSHHLSFEKDKVQRIINQNPVYYTPRNDTPPSSTQLLANQRQSLKKYHPFASYTDRRVFQPRDELDKFYDTESARKAASPRKLQEAVRSFEKVLQRKQAQLGQSAGLAYEVSGCLQHTKKRVESHSMQVSPRETILGRQVIDPKRGCRR